MRRRIVQIEVIFLYILTVVALAVREPEQTLLKNRVPAIPHGHAKAQQLLVIADTGNTIFTPAVGAGTRMVMSEIVPCIAILTVIFTDRAPLTFTEVRPPLFPVVCTLAIRPQTDFFLCHGETPFALCNF